jgi:alpha-methylacyl-CoA racemase
MKSLSGLKVLDLSTRLPGPMATQFLTQLGASVVKLEWEDARDAFSEDNPILGGIFQAWYRNLNQNKDVRIENFETFNFNEFKNYDIVFYSPSRRVINKLPQNITKIEIRGGKEQKYMHDLNALALSKTFKFNHDLDPPYLPFAGMIYAQQIALKAIAYHYNAANKEPLKLYLSETSKEVLDLLWDESQNLNKKPIFLHNGRFPCYNIYTSKDESIIALAAVEEKFWQEFCELFNLTFSLEDRFDASDKIKHQIQAKMNSLTINEIKEILGDRDICLNFLPS